MDHCGRDMLAGIAAERPRLMATKSAIERAQKLLGTNATARQWMKQVENQANLMLELPPLTSSWVHDPRETGAAPLPLVRPPKSSDGPAAPLDVARLFCLRIQTLGIMWLLTEDSRHRDRAKAELLAACAFPDWASDNKFLTLAETAFGAAIGYDWLYDSLTEGERAEVAHAILNKAVQPGLDQFAKPPPLSPDWPRTAMNWNLVCNGALMIAALSVMEADPRAARLFAMCRSSVTRGFREYDPDGGFAEGPGYWHYATQYAIYLLASLRTALGTYLELDASPGLSHTGHFRLHAAGPSGKLFNFADGEEEHGGGYWLFWLAKRYRHPIDASIEQHRGKVHPMDLLWFDDNGHDPTRLPEAQQFRAAGIVTIRGGWGEPKATYLGIKGGANDACEHGHYDLGSFVLDADGVRWAKDLGPDDYELPGYFTPEMRSRYYRTSTIGHNTLVIDGECQPPSARAVITHASFRREMSVVVMDLAAAYPSVANVVRGFALIDRRHVLIVDDIVPKGSLSSLAWQMHTAADLEIRTAATAVLTHREQDRGTERPRFYVRVLDPGTSALSSQTAAPTEPRGQNPNCGITKLVFQLDRVAQRVRLAVLLSPDGETCANFKLPVALASSPSEW